MNPLFKLKKIQKDLSDKIRKDHDKWDSITFRHQHIAYCELRGKEREEIERPAKNNKVDEFWITRIKKWWEQQIQEWRDNYAK